MTKTANLKPLTGPPRAGDPPGTVVAGASPFGPVRFPLENGHAFLAGGTGSGLESLVAANLVAAAEAGESLAVTDWTGGRLAEEVGPVLTARGYEVKIFDLARPDRSAAAWDPLIEARSREEVAALAGVMIPREGYFEAKEAQLFTALALIARVLDPRATLPAALDLLYRSPEELDGLAAERLDPEAREMWQAVRRSGYDAAASGLGAKTTPLRHPDLRALFGRHDLDLAGPGERRTALFCVANPAFKPVLAALYYFLILRLTNLARDRGGELPVPVRLVIHAAGLGWVPGLAEVLAAAPAMGVRVLLAARSVRDLDGPFGRVSAETVLLSCPVRVCLGAGDPDTAGYFARSLNEAGVKADGEELGRAGRVVVLARGHRPLFLERLDWRQLPQAAGAEG
ncbi:MAG: type IV secretory system conjugative DNA transfer family protein [Moorellales bacterium]